MVVVVREPGGLVMTGVPLCATMSLRKRNVNVSTGEESLPALSARARTVVVLLMVTALL